MLLRLLPEQVTAYWGIIKEAMEKSIPPIVGDNENRMNNILAAFLANHLICWASYQKGDKVNINAFMATTINSDYISGTKNLLIYAIYSTEETHLKDWEEGFEALSKYARSINCDSIIAYSKEPKILSLADKFKGDASYRFIKFPL